MAKEPYDTRNRPDYLLYRNFQQSLRGARHDEAKIAWKNVTASPEAFMANDLTNLMATIPSKIFQCDDCILNAFVNESGATTFCFTVAENAKEPEMAKDIIDDINDELRELALYGDIDGLIWNKKTNSINAATPDDLFEIFVNIRHYLNDFNNNMTTVLFSTAVSIYEDYQHDDDNIEKLHSPDEQMAIVRALESIVSTFDDTMDFTVIPSDEIDDDTGEVVFSFEIGVGKDTPISFEKRFQTLFHIFDHFDATEEILSPSTQIALGGCQTCFSVETTDLKSLFRPIVFLFNDTDLMEKAKDNKAKLFINPTELYSTLNDPNKGSRHAAFQH